MRFSWTTFGGRFGAAALIGLSALGANAAKEEAKDKPKEAPQTKVEVGKDVLITAPGIHVGTPGNRVFMTRAFHKLSDYWLGLDCSPMPPAMRTQLKLTEQEGIVVENVMPESPAAKAGFKQHDVLLSVEGKPLKDVQQLVGQLDENKDKEIVFQVLRNGEKMTVKATPEKRPQPEGPAADHLRWFGGDGAKTIEMLREQLEKNGAPMRMQFFHPGVVVDSTAAVEAFPDDLHVHFHKHGNKPAEIVVERGDKKWTVTEDKLADLPDDVRPHIEALLGRMPMPKFDVEIDGAPVQGAASFSIPLPAPGEISARIERRLEEMNERMDQMRKQISEMREERRKNREERREGREERHDKAPAADQDDV